MIEILKAGLLTTVQDLGRRGYAHLGVACSGALDRPALIRANRLVGNPDGSAGLETTLTGLTLRTTVPTVLAVTGARTQISINGTAVRFGAAVPTPAGAVVRVGPAEAGVRSYLAFAGGVTVAPVLGSRSTDTLSGLGPPPLRSGFVLPLGQPRTTAAPDHPPVVAVRADGATPGADVGPADADADPRRAALGLGTGDAAGAATTPTGTDADLVAGHGGSPDRQSISVRIRMGPRHDWFTFTARDALLSGQYALTVKSNRVGARLAGPRLTRATAGEFPSEGIVLGAVQVPANGQPLVFLADHPTTGGYPVIAVVCVEDVPLVAQARPGTTVRFVPWT